MDWGHRITVTIDDEDFVPVMETVDKRLPVPKKTKISNVIDKHYEDERRKSKKEVTTARRVSVGTDSWT